MEKTEQPIIQIKKTSGEKELFSIEKLIRSLRNAGAGDDTIQHISGEIQSWIYDGVTTQQIYSKAFSLLKKRNNNRVASQYKLKEAIMELGPTGYPFEQFMGKVIEGMGYSTKVGQIVQGVCVTHEVDVLATRDKEQCFVECKYGLSTDKNVNVKVPLYIRSRVNDIISKRKESDEYTGYTFRGWLVTNTRFTADAIDYGKCSGLYLLSWDYPAGNGLKEIIDRERIYPVTVLNHLSKIQKQSLIEHGIIICRQILESPEILNPFKLTKAKYNTLIQELNDILG